MPRPISSSKDAHDGDVSTSQQLACISARLQSLEEGQLDIRKVLQQLHVSLKAGNVLDAGMAERQAPVVRKKVAATERAATASSGFEKVGRLTFVAGQKTLASRRELSLKTMFEVAEDVEAEREQTALAKQSYASYMANTVSTMSRHEMEAKVDAIIGGVILTNAIFIGLAMDYQDEHPAWMFTDVLFSVTFIGELTFKIWVHGFVQQFFGSAALSNCFDAFLILLDLAQLVIELASPRIAKELDSAPSASLFRVVRLLRLTRLVRALKSDVFKSLAEMIHGIAAGMTTLAWSFVLFFLFLYTMSLVLREALGRHLSSSAATETRSIREMFDSVPRAIFTTFRCSFGDCSLSDGTPIFETVLPYYGPGWVFFYAMSIFVVSIVLFNVISAMFVERTMAAASALSLEKRRARLSDERHLFWKVTSLIKRIIEFSPEIDIPDDKLSECLSEVMQMEVPVSVVDEAIKDPFVIKTLNELDINPQDHRRLSDIFDPDNGGTVELADVAVGIRRMRGEPRRSDIVCIDLMIRSMQPVLAETLEIVTEIRNALLD